MKINKKLIIASILIFVLVLFSSIAFARPVTDIFSGGLLQINNFFENRAYEPYAKAIDFFFFSLLFIAIYMMGARYAFKEMKKPEQVIVILLGLMTAFLLVLGGFSATLLLPYIQWLLYLLLFLFYWWLLKGIQNKFWRFILALLLTLLTIGLIQGLYNYLTLPEVSGIKAPEAPSVLGGIGGFFKDLFGSFKGIDLGIGQPGIPDWAKGVFGAPTAPTGPEPLPVVPTPPSPEPEKERGPSWWVWLLIIALIALAIWKGPALVRRIRRPRPTPTTPLRDLINKITEIITKKTESKNKIEQVTREKNNLINQGDTKTGFLANLNATAEADIANLFLDPSRRLEDLEEGNVKEIIKKEREFLVELKKLKDLEKNEIYDKLGQWETLILRHIADDKKITIKGLLNTLGILIAQHVREAEIPQQIQNRADVVALHAQDARKGILWLIAYCFNLTKKENILAKKLEALFEEQHIADLVKGKFKEAIRDEATLEAYNIEENRHVALLFRRIELQIKLLEKLKEILVAAPTPTAAPLRRWPDDRGKHNPKPVDKPVYTDKFITIPPPPEPPPTRYRDVSFDLSEYFLPVKNQRYSNACVAFAGTAIMEYIINTNIGAAKLEHDLSEKFLWYQVRRPEEKNLNEGAPLVNAPISLRNVGECFERLWPWEPADQRGVPLDFAQNPGQEQLIDASQKRISRYRQLSELNPDSWIAELEKKNPILISVMVEDGLHQTGVRREKLYVPGSNAFWGNHAMVIVGFTTNFPMPSHQDGKIPAFKIRNSSGAEWGEDGYIWIPYLILPTLLTDYPYVLEGWEKGELKPEPPEISELSVEPEEAKEKGVEFGTPLTISSKILKGTGPFRAFCYIYRYEIDEKTGKRKKRFDKDAYTQIFPIRPYEANYLDRLKQTAKEFKNVSDIIEFTSEKDFGNLNPGQYKVTFFVKDNFINKWASKSIDIRINEPKKGKKAKISGDVIPEFNIDEWPQVRLRVKHEPKKYELFDLTLFARKKGTKKWEGKLRIKTMHPNRDYAFDGNKYFKEAGTYEVVITARPIVKRKILNIKGEARFEFEAKGKLRIEIIKPARDPIPSFTIGGKIYQALEAQAIGNKEVVEDINKEQKGYRFIWYIEQGDRSAVVHSGRMIENISEGSYGVIPDNFEQAPATLRAVLYDEHTNKIAEASMEVELLKGGALMRRAEEVAPKVSAKFRGFDFDIGVAENIGRKKSMEDSYYFKKNFLNKEGWFFGGVYDGYNGKNASIIAKSKMHLLFSRYLAKTKRTKDSFEKAYARLSDIIKRVDKSGTTSANVFIAGVRLFIAHAGDCRVLICLDNKPIYETKDHIRDKPELFQNTLVFLSRALGNRDLAAILSPNPDVEDYSLAELASRGTVRIVICSHGVLDRGIIRPEEVADIVNNYQNAQDSANTLLNLAFIRGATENLTVMVVKLIPKGPKTLIKLVEEVSNKKSVEPFPEEELPLRPTPPTPETLEPETITPIPSPDDVSGEFDDFARQIGDEIARRREKGQRVFDL